jgi:hypothetical protein
VNASTANARSPSDAAAPAAPLTSGRAHVRCKTPGRHRPARDLRGAVELERIAVAAVGAEHDVRVKHRHQRFGSPSRAAAKYASTTARWRGSAGFSEGMVCVPPDRPPANPALARIA